MRIRCRRLAANRRKPTSETHMARRVPIICLVVLAWAPLLPSTHGSSTAPVFYRGMCDASAVVTLGASHFVVADDEDNILRIYRRENGGLPVRSVNFARFLAVNPRSPEADIEGAARIGDRIYWITSHGRNKNGKQRFNRHRFFATTVVENSGSFDIKPVGRPYGGLLTDLTNDPKLAAFNLSVAATLAPKSKGALNIEGLCATPEGYLLLGFRNPVPQGKALMVPLLNPGELLSGQRARFGPPILLELGGFGIRSIAVSSGKYLIVAGSYDSDGQSVLYEWTGGEDKPRRLERAELFGLNPEAIEFFQDRDAERLVVVSDDGAMLVGGKPCKQLKDARLKSFRAVTLDF